MRRSRHTLPGATYHSDHPSGAGTLCAIRVEHAIVRARTQSGHVNRCVWHSGRFELIPICTPEIEVRAFSPPSLEPSVHVPRAVSCRPEPVHDFRAHLAATRPERRPDSGDEIGRGTPELPLKRLDGRHDDSLHGAAPSCVDRGHGTALAVSEEYRRTIGHADDER